jgi:ADP-ribosylglycohydrolase
MGERDLYRGCLLGGATGDALGYPVEFMSRDMILRKYGKDGITDLVVSKGGKALISDDTQMTLFTAEGIVCSETMRRQGVTSEPSDEVFSAYGRWLFTQGEKRLKPEMKGWLLDNVDLHNRRAPGNTCLQSLLSGIKGTWQSPHNWSKGCGGVMRTAPAGLFYEKGEAFLKGVEFAAITHGHPSGYLPGGALAFMIALIISGSGIREAAEEAIDKLEFWDGSQETASKLRQSIDLAGSRIDDAEAIAIIGEGWIGEEALAISSYCAIRYGSDFRKALLASVNHDGDSDSTGAITGNLLGARYGVEAIPADWIDTLELKDVLIRSADDLYDRYFGTPDWKIRYGMGKGSVNL